MIPQQYDLVNATRGKCSHGNAPGSVGATSFAETLLMPTQTVVTKTRISSLCLIDVVSDMEENLPVLLHCDKPKATTTNGRWIHCEVDDAFCQQAQREIGNPSVILIRHWHLVWAFPCSLERNREAEVYPWVSHQIKVSEIQYRATNLFERETTCNPEEKLAT